MASATINRLLGQIAAARQASNVERCHGISHAKSYSVGKHEAGCLKLLYILWPDDFARLAPHLLFHDDAEFVVGDIPGPTFWAFPDLGARVGELEEKLRRHLGFPVLSGDELPEDDRLKIEFCDKFEFALWAMEELKMGNLYAQVLLGRASKMLRGKEYPYPANELTSLMDYGEALKMVDDRVSELLEVLKK